jgi:hypothetical protein
MAEGRTWKSATRRPSPATAIAFAALFVAVGGGAYAVGATSGGSSTIHACAAKKNGALRMIAAGKKCTSKERAVRWGVSGPAGTPGAQGAAGTQGGTGPQGNTGPPGSDAQFNGATALGDLTGTYPAPALRPPEPWREINAPGQPGFQDGWTNLGGAFSTAAFYRDRAGVVHLKGVVQPGTYGGTVFVLPAGYRPPRTAIVAVSSVDGAAGFVLARVDIRAATGAASLDGRVEPFTGGSVYLSLDGISFRCDPSGSDGCP